MNRTLKFIFNHPLTRNNRFSAIINLLKWQIFSRVINFPIVYQFTEKSKLLVWRGLTGATGNFYCGLHEFEDMAFLLHTLREDDLFLDIGANVGSYTMLASSEIGAKTIAFEPILKTFKIFSQNIAINSIQDKVEALNIGLGSCKSVLKFTTSFDTGNHVSSPGDTESTEVNVDTLDNILSGRSPLLMKIDVEGFETEVLNGSSNTLEDKSLKAIIIELNGSGDRYGFDEKNIHLLLLNHGFNPYKYDPMVRDLTVKLPGGHHNTLYIRDLDFVKERLKTARKIKVKNKEV
ncbi:FkbM family methyltransferase [Pedobacter sp. WC2423]|uniref:FkbM family methyltransferase n=1 Tax=Pedobacter sp. WC2423 TaxID=3234142 RepID=UPI003466A7D3